MEEIAHIWGHNRPFNAYSNHYKKLFGTRLQKLSIDAGFSCPNRDGRVSHGGCSFCDNRSFSPQYCEKGKTIVQQIKDGKDFFAKKYPSMKYIAYFQAFTNTYGDIDTLKRKYEEALSQEDIVGLVIGTRPDAVDDATLNYLEQLNRQTFLIVEYGIESANDATLRRITAVTTSNVADVP